MELTDLILKLNSEATQNTPDVYKKVMAAARSEGLVKSKKQNSSQSNNSFDDYDYNYDDYNYDYDYGSRNAAPRSSGVGRRILSWLITIIIIILSITFLTITIKIVVPVGGDGSKNDGATVKPAPDATETRQEYGQEYELVID